MTEHDLFVQSVPLIAEMIVEARKICDADFEEWKHEILNSATEEMKGFVLNVIVIVDTYR